MRFFLLIRMWSLGILLAAATAFFSYQALMVWSEPPAVKKAIQKPPQPQQARRAAYHPNQRWSDFEVIARKDLFSSDRREASAPKPKAPASSRTPVKPVQLPDRRLALFGIVIDGGEKRALVTNLAKKAPEEKAYTWVKVGDKMGNLSVYEIRPDQIILSQGEQTYTLRLSDHKQAQKRVNPQKRKKPADPQATIIKKQKDKRPAAKESTDKVPAAQKSKASS